MSTKETILRAEREVLRAKQLELRREIDDLTVQIQALCKHNWQYMQVAGEGKYCPYCKARDFTDD